MIEIAIKLVYNVGIMFVMMVPGIIMKKCHLSTELFGKGLSNLVLYVAQPALVFLAYLRDFNTDILINIIWVLLFSILAHVVFAFAALHSFKNDPDGRRRMLRFCTVFSNAAFMGIPLIKEVLGGDATIYASVYNITFNIFLWSLGVYFCTEDRDEDGDGVTDGDIATDYYELQSKKSLKSSLKKALLHPISLAAFVGLIFFFLPINNYVPGFVIDSLTKLENLVIPLSMTVIGLRLVDIDIKGIFKDASMYKFLAMRHVILPVFIYCIIRVIALSGFIEPDVIKVVVIMACAPAASSATMFAEMYDCDTAYVSKLVSVSTVLSIFTMPFIVMLAFL